MLTFNQLLAKANEIKNEVIASANTAARVGTFLVELLRYATGPFSPNSTYNVGEYVIFSGILWRCVENTNVGESPQTAPGKWELKISSLQQITQFGGNITDRDVRLGSLGVDRLPRDVNAPLDVTATLIDDIKYFSHRLPEDSVNIYYPVILAKLIAEGRLNGSGGGTGVLTLGTADIDKLRDDFYQYYLWLEDRGPYTRDLNAPKAPKPAYPTLSGGNVTPALKATINSNNSKYEAYAIGASVVGNCSNGEDFQGRIIGINGATAPDQGWHGLSRIQGDATNGTYALIYYQLSVGGFLKPGDYKFQIRIGVDDSTIVEKTITVESTESVGTDTFEIRGKLAVWQNVQNELYKLYQKFSDGEWREFPGNKVWVIVEQLPGIGIAGGSLSGGEGIIQADRRITIRCGIGININLSILLTVNQTATTPTTPTISSIVQPFGRDDDYQGRLALANVTKPAQVKRAFYKIVNGLEVFLSETQWFDTEKLDGSYTDEGATVQKVWGFGGKPSEPGTYHVYDTWREKDLADTSKYKVLSPYYTVVVSAVTADPLASILKVAYSWQKNNPTAGQASAMQVYMSVTDNSYEIAFQYTYQGETTQKSTYGSLNTGSYVNGQYNRYTDIYNVASYTQERLFIRKIGTTTDLLVLNVPVLPASGSVPVTALYNGSVANTDWEYDND